MAGAKKPERVEVPAAIADAVLIASGHRCAVCGSPSIQLHHSNGDRSDNRPENLVVVCLIHHDQAERSGGLVRKLTPTQLRKYKRAWESKVKDGSAPPLSVGDHDIKAKMQPVFDALFRVLELTQRGVDEAYEADQLSTRLRSFSAVLAVEPEGMSLVNALQSLKVAAQALAFNAISSDTISRQNPARAADFAVRLENYREAARTAALVALGAAEKMIAAGSSQRDKTVGASAVLAELGETAYVLHLMLANEGPLQVPTSDTVYRALLTDLAQDLPKNVMAKAVRAYGHFPELANIVERIHEEGAPARVPQSTLKVIAAKLADLDDAVVALREFAGLPDVLEAE
jgi:hypothetical protein